jgi:hypothetical protein
MLKKYGLLSPKVEESDPWIMVCVDLVSLFTILTPSKTHYLLALTMIDPATGGFEIVEATNKSATNTHGLLHSNWLTWYPGPQFIVFFNGGKFKQEFKQICENHVIKAKPTKRHKTQRNAILEHIHKVVIGRLRSFDVENENLEGDNPLTIFFSLLHGL